MDDDDMLEALRAVEERLTSWEIDFLEDMEGWLEEHEELTPDQSEKLREIYDDRT